MARTLSQDFRDRVVAAERFRVSISSAIRWRRLALEHGQAVAKPRGGDRHSGKIEAHGGFIQELIAEQGDITLVEVQARLNERGVPVGIGTVHRFSVRHAITRKKDRARDRAGPPRDPEATSALVQRPIGHFEEPSDFGMMANVKAYDRIVSLGFGG